MQQQFYSALLAEDPVIPQGLKVWNKSDPAVRFAVYRNNVMASLIDALAENCPVLFAQLGESFFRAMAAEFIRQHPPGSSLLANYGTQLPEWIDAFPPLAHWPWLGDLTRLEMLFISSLHAEEPRQSPPTDITPGSELTRVRLRLHPSVRLFASKFAVFSLWSSHQPTMEISALDPFIAEQVMLWRVEGDVRVILLSEAEWHFLATLHSGMDADNALSAAMKIESAFDPQPILRHLLRYGLIVSFDFIRVG